MTIAERLKDREDELRQARIARRSALLKEFVQVTLLKALEEEIEKDQDSHFAPVKAPDEIRHLFAMPLIDGEKASIENPHSVYRETWDDILDWAADQGLGIGYGYLRYGDQMDVPHHKQPWMGYLTHRPKPSKAAPEKPTPPPPRKVSQGVTFGMLELIGAMALMTIVTFLITYFAMVRP